MYRILIADDEKKERDGIESLLTHFAFPFIIEKACNGEEALEKLQKQSYDLLLTDIKMPFMDGIDLLKHAQGLNMEMICVIYSAYGEFEYAQSAISLGVLRYLLKPIQIAEFQKLFLEIIGLLEKKKARLESERLVAKDQHLAKIYRIERNMIAFLEAETISPTAVQDLRLLEDRFSIQNYIPVLLSSDNGLFAQYWDDFTSRITQLEPSVLIINLNESQVLLVVFTNRRTDHQAVTQTLCDGLVVIFENVYHSPLFAIVGNIIHTLPEMKREYDEMHLQLDYRFFADRSMVLYQGKDYFFTNGSEMATLFLDRAGQYLQIGNAVEAEKELSKAFQYIRDQVGFSAIYVKYVFTEAFQSFYKTAGVTESLMDVMNHIYMAKTMEEIQEITLKTFRRLIQKQQMQQPENRIVKLARNYIFEHYQDSGLGLALIAEQVNVSPAYLSTLYKSETGQTVVKYITQYRMSKAKELLQQSNMKISDICTQVGYTNQSYFTQLFRSQEGVSPIQYREGVRGDASSQSLVL